jgi:PadR family transcriptional regulator PadR
MHRPRGGYGWQWRGASRRAARLVEPTLLLLLHQGAAHGYTLIGQLGDYDLADVDPSAIYRALRDMEDHGWVTSSWEDEKTQGPPRRIYSLTALGNEVLGWWAQDLQQTRETINRILGGYERHMQEGEGDYH